MQLIQAIALIRKQKINDSKKNVEKNNAVQDHPLITNTRVIFLDSTKLKIDWIKITTFFTRRVSIML